MNKGLTYSEAGVDIAKAEAFVEAIKPLVRATHRSGVMADIGGFCGLFSLNIERFNRPVLVASSDGVGTKLKVAFAAAKHDTVGIDLVAMCVNDIAVQGAAPLFLLDYLAMASLEEKVAVEIIKGVTKGCRIAKCALLGGETAEMPGFYAPGEYDLAGFVVGVVDKERIIDGSEIGVGHRLIGVASSGLHSNGYSLVRKVIFEGLKLKVEDPLPQCQRTVAEELLEPTKIYSELVLNLRRDFQIFGICHVTGGGIPGNLARILPQGCQAIIRRGSWEVHPIFHVIQDAGKVSDREMLRTFNNGIGLILVVEEEVSQEMLFRIQAMGEKGFLIGEIGPRKVDEEAVKVV